MTTTAIAKQTATVEVSPVSAEMPLLTRGDFAKQVDRDTFDAILAATQGVAADIQRATGDATEKVMWNLAGLTYNAVVVSGLVGKDVPNGFTSLEDFGKRALGKSSKSYVSRLRNLGMAVSKHGIQRGTKGFAILAANAERSPWAGLIRGEDTDALKAALKAEAEGRSVESGDKREPRPADEKVTDQSGKGPKVAEEVKVPRTAGDLITVVKGLAPALHDLDDAQAEKVHAAWLSEVARDRKSRATRAAKEAKAQAKADADGTPEDTTPEA